jgi:hypothetical protein
VERKEQEEGCHGVHRHLRRNEHTLVGRGTTENRPPLQVMRMKVAVLIFSS